MPSRQSHLQYPGYALLTLEAQALPRICEIEVRTQPTPWSEEIFLRCLSSGCECWGILTDQCIDGFIIYTLVAQSEGHILNLCVDPGSQRKGLGEKLLTHALTHAQSNAVNTVWLEVRRSNHPAISLYRKLGFSEVSVRKNYYSHDAGREDAVVYALTLDTDSVVDNGIKGVPHPPFD